MVTARPPPSLKEITMTIIEEIKTHEKEILSSNLPALIQRCLKCGENHEKFRLHDCKERIFLVIKNNTVLRIQSFLGRLKCFLCNKTFIHYPSYALPYKRYTVKGILNFSRRYGAVYEMTYKKSVREDQMAIGYEDRKRQFCGSTVFRWLTFLGLLSGRIGPYCRLISQKDPTLDMNRRLYPVNPRKHKSSDRKTILQQSLRVIDVARNFRLLFGFRVFPQLATGGVMN